MTQTAEQAQRLYTQMRQIAGKDRLVKMDSVQKALNESNYDLSHANGSQVLIVLEKHAKTLLKKIQNGEFLTREDTAKLRGAAYAASQESKNNDSRYHYDIGRRMALAELSQIKLEEARKQSIIDGADLPQDVRDYATTMYMDAKKDPKFIPDFLDFAAQISDPQSPLRGNLEILDEEDSIAKNPMEQIIGESDLTEAQKAHAFTLLYAADRDPSQTGALENYMNSLTSDKQPSKEGLLRIFSNPGKINELATATPLLTNPIPQKQAGLPVAPAVMPQALKELMDKQAANLTTTPTKLRGFSRFVPAGLVAAAAAACITVAIMASSLLFGNGDQAANFDNKSVTTETAIADVASEVMDTAPVLHHDADGLTGIPEIQIAQASSAFGLADLSRFFAGPMDTKQILPASFAIMPNISAVPLPGMDNTGFDRTSPEALNVPAADALSNAAYETEPDAATTTRTPSSLFNASLVGTPQPPQFNAGLVGTPQPSQFNAGLVRTPESPAFDSDNVLVASVDEGTFSFDTAPDLIRDFYAAQGTAVPAAMEETLAKMGADRAQYKGHRDMGAYDAAKTLVDTFGERAYVAAESLLNLSQEGRAAELASEARAFWQEKYGTDAPTMVASGPQPRPSRG